VCLDQLNTSQLSVRASLVDSFSVSSPLGSYFNLIFERRVLISEPLISPAAVLVVYASRGSDSLPIFTPPAGLNRDL
jgi:hypothetical protein